MRSTRLQKQSGFTLFEMSIVLAIIAAVTAGGLAIFNLSLSRNQEAITRERLAVLQKALLDYRRLYNRVPYAGSYIPGNTYYAKEDTVTPLIWGMVPVRTLKLADEYGYDGWGHAIAYKTSTDFASTTGSPFTTIPITETGVWHLTIFDASGGTKTDGAVYALVSFGPNGHGGYTQSGAGPFNGSNYNNKELANCGCNANGSFSFIPSSFYQAIATANGTTAATGTDDIVVYTERRNMLGIGE